MVVNPTQKPGAEGAAYPYGGTFLGRCRATVLQPVGEEPLLVKSEAGFPTDILEPDNFWIAGFFLRGFDDDAIRRMPGYERGPNTQHAVFAVPGQTTPGESALSRAMTILFVPDDPLGTPGFIIYNGVANWSAQAEVAFQRKEEMGLPLTVTCFRDGRNNILRIGILADLPLI